VPITYVSKMLSHANLTTTSRYRNIQRLEMYRAVEKLEGASEGLQKRCTRPIRAHKPVCPLL